MLWRVELEELDRIVSGHNDPCEIYEKFEQYYYETLPIVFRKHREYFEVERRAFGERAFHALHFLLFRAFRPVNILEIGVYRGQTVSLFDMLSAHFSIQNAEIYGISPLSNVGDNDSIYPNINYEADLLQHLRTFACKRVKILKEYSVSQRARQLIKSRKWDYVYIDGSHEFQDVLIDYLNCADTLSEDGILILDDANLHTRFRRIGAFSGHFGPSEVNFRFASKELDNFLNVGHNACFRRKR
jgi:hypothetical protein